MSSRAEHIIVVSNIGRVDGTLLEPIRDEVDRVFGYSAHITPILQHPLFAFDPGRNQYFSTRILEMLAQMAPPQALKVLAVTDVDLFIPILTHVYGEAQLGGKACIISTYRLREALPAMKAQEVFVQRIIKEALHELGHTFNLRHCPDRTCLMHYCRNEGDVDRKSEKFCRYCRILLEDEVKK